GAADGFNAGDTSSTVGLAAGENITCVYTNTKNGSITIQKVMVGGTGTFTFTGTPGGTISTNNGTITATLPPGTYSTAETVPAGWVLTNIVCTGQSTSTVTIGATGQFDAGDTNSTVNLAAGENITCVYTNTKNGSITIQKVMVGGTGTFTFTGTPGGTISTNNGTITATLPPGTYSTAETVPAGWVLTNIVCSGQSTSTVTIGATGQFDAGDTNSTVNLAAGENITCVYTNTKNGSITIQKVMVGGTGTFTFTGTPGGTISTNNGTITATLPPGTYSTAETVPAGWVLTNIVCTGQSTSTVTIGATGQFDAGDTNSTVNLAAGENITCVYTNTKNGSITIQKVMVGGTGTFTFTGTPGGTISTNNGTITATLPPGTYSTAETVPAGWVLTNIVCSGQSTSTVTIGATGQFDAGDTNSTVNLAAGENITCVYTNTKNGSITIQKVMVGGTGTFTFTGTPGGTISTNNGTITATLPPGTYSTAETVPAGWVLTNIVCSGQATSTVTIGAAGQFDAGDTNSTVNLAAGENITCVYTNTKNSSITIQNVMVGGSGTFTFTGTPGGTISTNNGTITQSLPPGTYSTAETVPAGWVLTNIVCTGQSTSTVTIGATGQFDAGDTNSTVNLAAGENITCVYTNTKNSSITIQNVMVGGSGTFTFTGTPGGTISTNNGTITQSLPPGTYSTAETVPAGWVLTNIVCTGQSTSTVTIGAAGQFDAGDTNSTVNLAAGENITCVYTNTKNGSITIQKVMVGGSGTFTFTGTPGGTISTNNGTITQSLPPGTYTTAETVPAGWVLTNIVCTGQSTSTVTIGATGQFDAGDTNSTVNLAAGENITCVYTNTKNGSITIQKVM